MRTTADYGPERRYSEFPEATMAAAPPGVGWVMFAAIMLGVLQVLAGLALLSGSEVARWFGIVVAGVNAFGQLNFIPAYPLWGISMFAVDLLIIYGLAVYGGARLRAFR